MVYFGLKLADNPALEKVCKKVENFPELEELLEGMSYLMHLGKANGISATQVGDDRQVILLASGEAYVNPRIISQRGIQLNVEECMSLPKKKYLRLRPAVVTIEYQDRQGASHQKKFYWGQAAILKHEMDHLNGKQVSKIGLFGGLK